MCSTREFHVCQWKEEGFTLLSLSSALSRCNTMIDIINTNRGQTFITSYTCSHVITKRNTQPYFVHLYLQLTKTVNNKSLFCHVVFLFLIFKLFFFLFFIIFIKVLILCISADYVQVVVVWVLIHLAVKDTKPLIVNSKKILILTTVQPCD